MRTSTLTFKKADLSHQEMRFVFKILLVPLGRRFLSHARAARLVLSIRNCTSFSSYEVIVGIRDSSFYYSLFVTQILFVPCAVVSHFKSLYFREKRE